MIQCWPDTISYYRDWLAFRQRYLRVPGVQAAVWRDGGIAFSAAYGHADVERGTALTEQHLFRIASHSKTFTAVAILQLVEQGRLRLDARLGTVVPALAGSPVAHAEIRELVTHSAGVIRDSRDGDFWQGGFDFPDADGLIAIALESSTAVLPRNERFKYSNIAFGLLGLVIEVAAGRGYHEQLRAGVLEPLGLRDTGPELATDRAGDYAVGYSAYAYADERRPIPHVDTRALAAATGFYATARDLATFFAALLPGDDRLLTENSKRQMQHAQWEVKGSDDQYGMGVGVLRIGDRTVFGHGGGYPGHITRTLADREHGIVVSVLTNAIDGPADGLLTALYRLLDLAEGGSHAVAGADAIRFTGRFASLWGVLDIALLDGRLYALSPAAVNPAEDATPLEVVDENTLKIVGGSATGSYGELVPYVFNDDGTVRSLRGASAMTMRPL